MSLRPRATAKLSRAIFVRTAPSRRSSGISLSKSFGTDGKVVLEDAMVIRYFAISADFGPGKTLSIMASHWDGSFKDADPRAPKGLGFHLTRIGR